MHQHSNYAIKCTRTPPPPSPLDLEFAPAIHLLFFPAVVSLANHLHYNNYASIILRACASVCACHCMCHTYTSIMVILTCAGQPISSAVMNEL